MRTFLRLSFSALLVAIAAHADSRDAGTPALADLATATDGVALATPGFVFDGKFKDAIEFFKPHDDGNGRSCATCHRPEDNFSLTPATVEARYQALQARRKYNPNADDPLFRSIDADDFKEDFTTLRTKALVRVVVPLPQNVKLADDPAATSVALWRAVPTVINAGLSAPYQYDGRLATLKLQALSAMQTHGEVTREPKQKVLQRLEAFQRHLFSSPGVRKLANALEHGAPPPDPTPHLNALERAGKSTFEQFCTSCHGGPTQTVNADARFLPVAQRGPAVGAQPFVNIFVQTPRPPAPFFNGLPSANLLARTYLVTAPDGKTVTSVVTTDPGRGLISGDIRDFGRLDVPTLFGVSKKAPYFHDNSAATLEQVIQQYQALFGFIKFLEETQDFFAPPGANGEGCAQGTCGIKPIPEAEIPGLLAFLRKL
jgi:cytochrome c peroxidase